MQRRVALLVLASMIALASPGARAGFGDGPYVGEVRTFGFGFCPVGWVAANGQLLSIAEYDTLFNLYGTTYGGDGQETFAVPDLRGRIPIGTGTGAGLSTRTLGELGGTEEVTLTVPQLPTHTHVAGASSQPVNAVAPTGTLRGPKNRTMFHRTGGVANTTMAAGAVGSAGGSQPVANQPPFVAINVCVSLFGVYPHE